MVPKVSDQSEDKILDLIINKPDQFKQLSEQEKYLCKRAVSKSFTEFALKTQAGRMFNKMLIWDMASYASELINAITGQKF